MIYNSYLESNNVNHVVGLMPKFKCNYSLIDYNWDWLINWFIKERTKLQVSSEEGGKENRLDLKVFQNTQFTYTSKKTILKTVKNTVQKINYVLCLRQKRRGVGSIALFFILHFLLISTSVVPCCRHPFFFSIFIINRILIFKHTENFQCKFFLNVWFCFHLGNLKTDVKLETIAESRFRSTTI